MQKLIYTIAMVSVVGVFTAFWAFRPDHQNMSNETGNVIIREALVNSNTLPLSPKVDNKQNNEHSNTAVVVDSHCSELCNESLELLNLPDVLTDEEYEEALSNAEDLAAYLKQNPDALANFLELAKTDDGDKRSVMMAVFYKLDIEDRLLLGDAFLESTNFRSRYDGVNFLAQVDIMDEEIAQRFSEMLVVESDQFVRNAIVKALNQPDRLYGHYESINVLEQVSNQELDDIVRGEALLARVQLEENPEQVFAESLSAIRSDVGEYQLYGLRALEQIITRQVSDELELSPENKDEAKHIFDELRNSGYGEVPLDVIREANIIYARYFDK